MKHLRSFYNRIKALFLAFVICRLGWHDWENIDRYVPNPKEGEMIALSNLHRCRRCKKEQHLGMGIMC